MGIHFAWIYFDVWASGFISFYISTLQSYSIHISCATYLEYLVLFDTHITHGSQQHFVYQICFSFRTMFNKRTTSPQKLTCQWKITIFNRRYIDSFMVVFSHRHSLGFRGRFLSRTTTFGPKTSVLKAGLGMRPGGGLKERILFFSNVYMLGCISSGGLLVEISLGKSRLVKYYNLARYHITIFFVSKNKGTPKWMVYFMENPIKMG